VDKTIKYRSIDLSYATHMPGHDPKTPLVLIHGFAEDRTIWDNQTNYLNQTYPLIIPDLPGSGRSTTPPGDTTMESLAEAIKAILDAENIQECIMIGHSMGGYITLAFAEKYPDSLKAFGLFHSTAYADTEEKKEARRKGIDFIRRNGAGPFIKQSTPNLFAETSRTRHPEWIAALIDRYAGFDANALINYYEAMIRRPDRTRVLQQFPRPVILIIGEQDSTIPLHISLQQSHMPACSYIHILENAGHMGMMEESIRANQLLEEMLNDINYE
jgi:pimeloyl-ACP methyl ester carboxylesterase